MRDGAQNGKFNPLRLLLPRIRSPRCKIPETIVIKFVVRPQSWKRSCTHAVSEEDLSRCVNPCWTFLHVGPINLKKFRCRTCSFIFCGLHALSVCDAVSTRQIFFECGWHTSLNRLQLNRFEQRQQEETFEESNCWKYFYESESKLLRRNHDHSNKQTRWTPFKFHSSFIQIKTFTHGNSKHIDAN